MTVIITVDIIRIITTIIIHNIANRHIEMADIITKMKKALFRGLFYIYTFLTPFGC